MTVMQAIEARRSIRHYTDQPVTDEELLAVLEAGRLAPSARNLQGWHFTAVRDASLRGALCTACNGQQMVAEAPAALVVWADGERMMGCGQSAATIDCSIALSFMLLRATELGLGSCWLGAFDQNAVSLDTLDTALFFYSFESGTKRGRRGERKSRASAAANSSRLIH